MAGHSFGTSRRRGRTLTLECSQMIRSNFSVVAALWLGCVSAAAVSAADVYWGFTPFPYDFTAEAATETYSRTSKLATVFAIHRDNGIPWQEALDDSEFPQEVRDQWGDHARNTPKGQKIYLGLAPLATDRESLAPSSKGSKTANSFLRKSLASDEVKRAYLNYVRRAVETFHPDYLNIGIEVGELAKHSKSRWQDFEVLFDYVRARIKQQYPDIQLGISFGLYTLMEPEIAERSRRVVEQSDYIGISFYPYVGAPNQLQAPPTQWRDPLDWLRQYTTKPIAMVETGYSSTDVTLASPEMHLHGTPELQQQYLTDLAAIAVRDKYLMVNWFLLTDYDALSARAGFKSGDGARLWEHIGLLDRDLRPKPALAVWQKALRGEITAGSLPAVSPSAASSPRSIVAAAATPSPGAAALYSVGFAAASDLFQGSGNDRMSLADDTGAKSMNWEFTYEKDRFQWAHRALTQGALAGATEFSFSVKSVQPSYILVAVEESGGESYWAVFKTSSDWQQQQLSFASFQRDEKKKKEDGKLQVENIIGITIADARALEGANGPQQIWIANWVAR